MSSEGVGLVCGHVYNNVSPTPDLAMGKYAAMLHLTPTTSEAFSDLETIRKLGRDIAQHIIGAAPVVISEGEEGVEDPALVLTKQGFVLNEEVLVGDMLAEHGARVTQFVRYALGGT